MEILFIAIALSCSANLDNLAVGVAYSTKSKSIPFLGNFIIALLSGLSTWAAMSLGTWADQLISVTLSQWLGSGLLIMLGAFSLWEQWQHHWQPALLLPEGIIEHPMNQLSLQDSFCLGLGLTISNLGTGIGAGMTHINIGLVSSLSIGTSLVMICGGTWLGKVIIASGSDNRFVGWVTGLALIILGTYEAIA